MVAAARGVRADALEAVDPRHLLDQVLLDLEVEAKARRADREAFLVLLEGEPQTGKNLSHLFGGDRNTDHLLSTRDAHRHRLALRKPRHEVLGRPRLAAADVEDEARRSLDSVDIVLEVDAALEAVRGVAREVIAARTPGERI